MYTYQTALSTFVSTKDYMNDATNTRCILAKKTISRLSDKRVTDLLDTCQVDASKFNSDLYLNSYITRFVRYTFTRDVNDYFKVTIVAFRTAMLCYLNNEDALFSDFASTVSNNDDIADKRSHVIFHHSERIADQNYRQTNAAINSLERLNIIKSKGKNFYSVQVNAIAEAMIAALQIDMTSNDEEIEVEMLEIAESEITEILDSETLK